MGERARSLALDSVATRSRYGGGRERERERERERVEKGGRSSGSDRRHGCNGGRRSVEKPLPPVAPPSSRHRHSLVAYNKVFFFSFFFSFFLFLVLYDFFNENLAKFNPEN